MSAVRIAAKALPAESGLIILHGLGDNADGFPRSIANVLRSNPTFAHTSFILPNAPIIPVTVDNGRLMPSWFDMSNFGVHPSEVDTEGFLKSVDVVEKFVMEHINAGIKPEKIFVCGFSQGAALTLASAATLPVKLGGFVAFSGFVTIPESLKQIKKDKNLETPIFHGHGDADPIVPLEGGKIALNFYRKQCGLKNLDFKIYRGMDHTICPDEMDYFVTFLKNLIN